ncbi:MAG: hypothetical protein HQM08_03705 [Candidatus Riflebacteria bacterium]|nr:hypothetical protein [Candidatus Riflebacteria bacterium]
MKIESCLKRISVFFLFFCLVSSRLLIAQEDKGTIAEAKTFFEEAKQFKKNGNVEKAIKSYEKAIRANRGILAEDDDGLIGLLRDFYQKKVEKKADDRESLEAMGFISEVCDSDLKKAIDYYSKALPLIQDEKEKNQVTTTLERLNVQSKANPQSIDPNAPKQSPDYGQKDPTKQAGTSDKSATKDKIEEKISGLNQKRDDLSSKISQLEDSIKDTEQEAERAHRMYYSTNDRRYKREDNKFESDLASKRSEIDNAKRELDQVNKQIDEEQKRLSTAK